MLSLDLSREMVKSMLWISEYKQSEQLHFDK